MDNWKLIVEELECYRSCMSTIRHILSTYEEECVRLIDRISKAEFNDSQDIFDELHAIQRRISTIKYKYDFPLSDRLLDFEYHLDRDDVYSRKYWYERFKGGLTWPNE